MRLWGGDIACDNDDGPEILRDVHIYSSHPCGKILLPNESRLKTLDLVYVSDIPLHLVAGPTLDVSSGSTVTEGYLSSMLLGESRDCSQDVEDHTPWWRRPLSHSGHGILLKVDPLSKSDTAAATELLVYAAVEADPHVPEGLITPPRSSSPDFDGHCLSETPSLAISPTLKVYALPLDSRRLESIYAAKAPTPVELTSLDDGEARFINGSANNDLRSHSVSHKRRKLSTAFDDATQQRKKAKGRGGESVSRAMAKVSLKQPGKAAEAGDLRKTKITQSPHDAAPVGVSRKSLSRASSVGSLSSLEPSRPPSSRATFVAGKRSSLHRVESVMSVLNGPADNQIEQQNKSTLAKIVMAGMRVYGLQQKKSCKNQIPLSETFGEEYPVEDPGEYKAIYHQTYKAASFAFRAHFRSRLVPQESMREVVDRLLSIFCNDPTPCLATFQLSTGDFGSQEERPDDVFDQPTSHSMEAIEIEASCSRRKKPDIGLE